MKIAILTSGGVDRTGVEGVIPCLLSLIERLSRAGDEVHVFALCGEPLPATWHLRGATIHNAGQPRTARRMFRQMRAEHRMGRFDVIHSGWSLMGNMVGVTFGRLHRVPTLVWFCGNELIVSPDFPTVRASRRGRLMLRYVVTLAHRIAVQSAPMILQARRLRLKVERFPLGVDLDHWPPAPPRARAPTAVARLLSVGTQLPVKDQTMLINMAADLHARGLRFELDIIGLNPSGSSALQDRVAALGLADRIHFRGFVPQHRLRPFFDRADLLIVTSRQEGGPIVALEAAVAGVPVVGTNVGHLAEWAPVAARVVEPRDAAGLARIVTALLADDAARLALAAAAQQRAVAQDAKETTTRFRQLYLDMARRC
jgi:glycosyltransferase involved in cell wall biosynthesis